MLENATVTMPYNELQEILGETEHLRKCLNKTSKPMTDEEFEQDMFKKALDEIFDLLDKASEQNDAEVKQHFIYLGMMKYCEVFKIPPVEVMEGISKGKES